MFLQKINGFPLISVPALKMLHGNPDQIQISHRKIVRPELPCQSGHPGRILRLQQHFHPPVKPRYLLRQVLRFKSGFPCKIPVIGIGKGAEIALKLRQPLVMADDGKALQIIQHIRRGPGKPCGKKLLQKHLHLSGRFLHPRHIIFLGLHNLPKQHFLCKDAGFQLTPEYGRGLMYAHFLFMAAAGRIFQGRQQLYRMLLPRQLHRNH